MTRQNRIPGVLHIGYVVCVLICLASPATSTAQSSATPGSPLTGQEFRDRLTGPILAFPTPFTAEDHIDYDGVRRMIKRALAYDEVRAVTLTAGNNQFKVLSFDEVKELTRVVVEVAGDRALSIASTGFWDTEQVLEYARFAGEIGASALQVLKPADASDEEVTAFYQKITETTRLPLVLHGEFSPELLRELVKIELVAAMKEDAGLDYLIARQIEFGDRLAIFPGGFDSRYLVGYPYGVRAYYTAFYQFAPALGHQFWQRVEQGDLQAAGTWVKQYDFPFAQRWSYPFWEATCAYFGVCEPYVRPRENSLDESQTAELKSFWNGLGLTAKTSESDVNLE